MVHKENGEFTKKGDEAANLLPDVEENVGNLYCACPQWCKMGVVPAPSCGACTCNVSLTRLTLSVVTAISHGIFVLKLRPELLRCQPQGCLIGLLVVRQQTQLRAPILLHFFLHGRQDPLLARSGHVSVLTEGGRLLCATKKRGRLLTCEQAGRSFC